MQRLHVVQIPRRFVRSEWGGTETVILETCKRLQALGHATEILCPNALAKTNHEIIDGISVTRTPYFYPYFGLSAEQKLQLDKKGGNLFSFALGRALRRMPALDLIHLHTGTRLGGIARHEAVRRRIPYVVSLHGGIFDVPAEEAATWTAPTQRAIEWGKVLGWWVGSRRVHSDAAALLCVGKPEQVLAQERFPGKRVEYLPNGVDVSRFEEGDGAGFRAQHGIPAEAFVTLTVARIDTQKNQAMLVRLLPAMRRIEPRTHLVLVGPITNPAYCEALRKEIAAAGIGTHVTLLPGIAAGDRALADAYHAADMFVLPSLHEPFGIVVLEAWAAGRAVLAARVGGVPWFVDDGRDGLLFDPKDDAEFLRVFEAAAHNPELRRALAKHGHAKAGHEYSWDAITRRLANLYEDVVRENPLRKR